MRRLARSAVLSVTAASVLALIGLSLAPVAVAAPPSAPQGVTVTVATSDVPEGKGRFTVNWLAVTGAIAYRVEASIAGVVRASVTVTAPQTSGVLEDLTGGQRYSVRVKAANADGYGTASNAVDATALTVPSPVSVTEVTAFDDPPSTDDTVLVQWSAPANTGGAPIQAFRLEQRSTGDSFTTLSSSISGSATSFVVSTNTDRQAIGDYRVSANNGYGWSSTVESAPIPNAPRSLAVSVAGSTLSATWQAPAIEGSQLPIAGYVVAVVGIGADDTALLGGTSYTRAGLAGGDYDFLVAAIDTDGNEGPPAATSFTVSGGTPTPQPGTPPGPPTGVVAVAGDATADVSWTAPSQEGSFPITDYRVTSIPVGGGCTATATSCQVKGLVNGTTYTFTVAALNGAGYGAESEPSNAVTPQASPEPTPTPTPSPTPEVEMPARVVTSPGDRVRVRIETNTVLSLSTLRAYLVVKGKRRNLGATFRETRGGDIVMRFTVERKPGKYPLLLAQIIDGKAVVLDRSRLVVRRGRRLPT